MTKSMTLNEAKKQTFSKEDIERLKALQNSPVDTSEIHELTHDDFKAMYRPIKKSVTLRLDADILEWLKSSGKGYQTKINSILRKAMTAML